MPNKHHLEDTIEELKEEVTKEKKYSKLLLKQQKNFKLYAEKAGSEMSSWKHKYILLQEKYNTLKAKEKCNLK